MTGPPKTAGPLGRLVVVSGPSGVGKSAVAARLLEDRRFGRAVTATTRPPRPGERDGVDYRFLSEAEFRRRQAENWFLESATVYGNLYGTPRSSVDAVRGSGRHCLLVVDTQGARTLFGMRLEAVFVFLLPPSLEELVRRLMSRGGDPPESFERRMKAAEQEMREGEGWPHCVVNHDVGRAAREIAAWVGIELA